MEHDWRSVCHISELVAKRLAPQVVIAPAMNIGISEHHMRHIGTLTAMPGSWLGVLFDTIVAEVCKHLQAMIDGQNVIEIPAFHPSSSHCRAGASPAAFCDCDSQDL